MALPVTITGISTAVATVGPFKSSGGNYYFFGVSSSTATTLQAYKSTTPDTSWASVTTKTGFATAIQYLSAYQVADVIHMVVTDGTATSSNHKYQTFNMASDTFVTAETINSALNTQTSTSVSQYNTSIVVRSTSEVVVLTNVARVSTFSQISYRRRTGVNTWAAAVAVSATGVNCTNPIAVLGASDRLHFLHFNSTNTIQRHLTSANALGTAASTGATALPQDVATWSDAGVIRHCGLTATSSFRWTSLDNPTVFNTANTFGTPVRVADDHNAIHALYRNSADSDLYARKSFDTGATFDTGTNVFTGTVASADTNLSKNQQIYTRGSSVVFPYIVNDSGALKYNESSVVQPAANAWSFGDKSANATLSNNDKTVTGSTNSGARSTTTRINGTAGKYYAEFVATNSVSEIQVGVKDTTTTANVAGTGSFAVHAGTGNIYINNAATGSSVGGSIVTNDVVCIAWDTGAERVWFRLNNGVWNNDGAANPATGTNGIDVSFAASNAHGLWFFTSLSAAAITIRTELAEFSYTSGLSGFTSWMGEALSSATHYTMPAARGTFTLTGTDATLTKSTALTHYTTPAATGGFALTGVAAATRTVRRVPVTVVAYALTGIATALHLARKLATVQGAVVLTGVGATLTKTTVVTHYTVPATAGAVALNGVATTLRADRKLPVTAGSYVLTGTGVALRAARVLAGTAGSYVLTGADATLKRIAGQFVSAEVGRCVLVGSAVGMLHHRVLRADGGSYALTGTDASLSVGTGEVEPPIFVGGGGFREPAAREPHPVEGVGYGILPRLEGEAHGVVANVAIAAGILPDLAGEIVGSIGTAGRSEARLLVRAAASGQRGELGAAAARLKGLKAAGNGCADDERDAVMALLLAA